MQYALDREDRLWLAYYDNYGTLKSIHRSRIVMVKDVQRVARSDPRYQHINVEEAESFTLPDRVLEKIKKRVFTQVHFVKKSNLHFYGRV